MKPERLAQMRAMMVMEGQELLEQLRADLAILAASPDDVEARERLCRPPHTIASGAGLVGEEKLSEFAGRVEDCARRARDPGFALGPERLAALHAAEVLLGAWLLDVQVSSGETAVPADTATALALLAAFEAG